MSGATLLHPHAPTPAWGRAWGQWADEAADRLVLRVYTIDLVLVVLTQKLAFPLGGRESQVTAAMLLHLACLAYLAVRGQLRVAPGRLVLFCLFTCLVALSQIFGTKQDFSLPSMVLMLSIGAMLVFVAPLGSSAYRRMLNRFVLLALAAAAMVGVDWAVQAAGFPMPDLEALIPRPLVYYEYNYIQPLAWSSPWMKPNGLVFLEASHVSQFIALGLVVELALFRRLPVVLALGAALLATYGVTGLLLVATCVPFLLAQLRKAVILGIVGFICLAGPAAYQAGLLDNFLRRTSEFSQDSSSGYNRFVLPFEWSVTAVTGPADLAWLGTGAGSMPKAINDEEAGTAGYTWPPYTKVIVEYGALAFMAWLLFIARSLVSDHIPLVISWAAFAQYNFLNGSLNVPIHTIYCVLLCAGYQVHERRSSRAAALSRGSALPLSQARSREAT